MNKTPFVQQASITMLGYCMDKPQDKRLDLAVTMAEKLWAKLDERGYGAAKQADPKETRDWYKELPEDARKRFEGVWKAYGKVGARHDAAKAYLAITDEEALHDQILYAISKYKESLHATGTSQKHLATWFNSKSWEGYEVPKQRKAVAQDTDAALIKHVEKQLEYPNLTEENKKALEDQLKKLRG